jgi:hypothetical protein
LQLIIKKLFLARCPVAHACNPRSLEGEIKRKPAQANSLWDYISKITIVKWTGVWHKRESICFANVKPWVQTLVSPHHTHTKEAITCWSLVYYHRKIIFGNYLKRLLNYSFLFLLWICVKMDSFNPNNILQQIVYNCLPLSKTLSRFAYLKVLFSLNVLF